jgi:ATP-dependent Clp protease ATP-binding subunit ClpX
MMEGVELEIEEGALDAVVAKAVARGGGARALRAIVEEVMLDIMYQLPSRQNVSKCIITKDTIVKSKEPIYLYEERKSA